VGGAAAHAEAAANYDVGEKLVLTLTWLMV
jgi:hypothetical protein